VTAPFTRAARLLFLLAIRYSPFPWALKWHALWLFGPRVDFRVCALIADDQGRLLALRSTPGGRWELPSARVNRGECAPDVLALRCREQLHLSITKARIAGIQPLRTGRVQCAFYRCDLESGSTHPGEESGHFAYVAPDALPRDLRDAVSSFSLDTDR
jgi:NUDIX domain